MSRTCPYCGQVHDEATSLDSYGLGIEFVQCPGCRRTSLPSVAYGPEARLAPAPVLVTLTEEEIRKARDLAEQIVQMDVDAGWQMYFDPGGGESRLDVNARGFGAELAAARATGLPRNEHLLETAHYTRRSKPVDLGQRTEVRSTRSSTGFLYVYKADPRGRYALLVTGSLPTYRIVGWIRTSEARHDSRWREQGLRHPAYVVEQRDLHPLPLPEDA